MSVRPYRNKKKEIQPGKWEISVYPQGRKGKRIRIMIEGTEIYARTVEAELRKQHSLTGPKVNPTINTILPEFLEWLKLHRAERTYRDFLYSLKFMQPHFGPLQVTRITPAVITQYQLIRAGRPRATNKELTYLQSIISWMVRNNYCHPLPFKVEKVPYHRPIPQVPHPADIERFIAAFDDPLKKLLVMFIYDCGLRWKEASTMRWEQIDLSQGYARIKGKGGKERFVLLTDRLSCSLVALRKPDGYIFINQKTKEPWGHIRRAWATVEKKTGLKINPHLLRHAHATFMLGATGDLRLVQTALGHADIKTTEIYTHISLDRLKIAQTKTAAYTRRQIDSYYTDIKDDF